MSATAFQRARREAAATMRAAAEADAKKEKEDHEYTVTQLKEMCDEKGIEYKARATKAELIELLGL